MLAIERRNKILAMLQRDSRVVVSDLSASFNVTEETIRRDLDKLEKEGFAKKTYGGAIINESLNVDLPYTVRKKANVTNKQYIAEIISSVIEDGDHIMMDASSTAVYVAKHLKNKKNITIITNSIEILLELSEVAGWKVLSTGGTLREGSLSLVGYQAEKMITNYHVDKAIISCKGIDLEKGITDSNEMDAHIKKLMFESANTKILAADNSKFNKISFTKIGDLSDIDIMITDSEPEENWKQVFNTMKVETRY
ncbi:DeoR/GlpR family DNA-binding transcription regulator [Anaerocolumna sp. AGMB13025]|uniref:DeoR/GlpR family DNA-binding transcription regulator n=1 Tax=Anaerocolumna sp. AGMB13025 TaxID=3039116 RepID=UPI00241EF404|nr:DeoR/GlpR family DNA-binding transcription regulator [Anaerocolumna sp. AGMB13025]WFR55163.1 DeoR/GlpR family DNA-binding transcription regulator [Anaerocolumna sp. AGMB13025]